MTAIVAGQLVGMRKKGDSQAFVQLEDGKGRIECAFFSETWLEYAPLLTRDRILVVEGGLREDEFSGGFALRARRCWEYSRICAQFVQRVSVRIDVRDRTALDELEKTLAAYRGETPLMMEVITPQAVGRLSINGGNGVRVEADLPAILRATPGIKSVRIAVSKPWAQ